MSYQRFCLGTRFNFHINFPLFLFFFLLFQSFLFSQNNYLMSLSNGEKINQTTYDFDVTLTSTGGDFELTSYQAVFSFDTSIAGSGNVSFAYLENTSELSNVPSVGIGMNVSDGRKKLTFASYPGSDIITNHIYRVGRFRLESATPFEVNPSINWSFSGKITTIITGSSFTNITNPSNHNSEISELRQVGISGVTASGISDPGTAPEKTIDGLGFNDGDPLSRWATSPMPQWISYDLGSEQEISSVKVSFFNFQDNRIYEYSISASHDNMNWQEVISNAHSAAEEWTVAEFSPVTARYIKIDLISSTNNPNGWANIWETEIWSGGQTTSAETEEEQPSDFELMQNYPNPFNPTTKIAFNLKQDAKTTLSVYNTLGEKVTDLLDDYLTAGKHEIAFNGEGLASGIYIYKLDVGNEFTDIKKMVLIK